MNKSKLFTWAIHNKLPDVCRFLKTFAFTPKELTLEYAAALDIATVTGRLSSLKFLGIIAPTLDQPSLTVCNYKKVLRSAAEHGHLNICQFLKESELLTPADVLRSGAFRLAIRDKHFVVSQFLQEWALSDASKNLLHVMNNAHWSALQFIKEWQFMFVDLGKISNNFLVFKKVAKPDPLEKVAFDIALHVLHFLSTLPSEAHLANVKNFSWSAVHCGKMLQIAAKNGCLEVFEFFKNWGLREYNTQLSGILEIVAEHGHVNICQCLKEWEIDKTFGERHFNVYTHGRALQCAAQHGHLGICQILKDWKPQYKGSLAVATHTELIRNIHKAGKLAKENGHTDVYDFLGEWATVIE